jgi:hypothetical protein
MNAAWKNSPSNQADMSIPKQHPLVLQAAVQDLLAAVWELQDLTRDVSREARNLADILQPPKPPE